jgi:hypothetical protein
VLGEYHALLLLLLLRSSTSSCERGCKPAYTGRSKRRELIWVVRNCCLAMVGKSAYATLQMLKACKARGGFYSTWPGQPEHTRRWYFRQSQLQQADVQAYPE